MNLQETIDQPTFHRVYFSSSFYLHDAKPSGLVLEGRIPAATRKELAARGHKVEVSGDWAHGKVMAVRYGEQHGVLAGAVSPRREIGYLMGDWRALPAAGEGARPASAGRWTVARSARPASAGRSRRREIHRPAHAGLSPRVVVSPGMLWRAFWLPLAAAAGVSVLLGLPFDAARGGAAWYVLAAACLTTVFRLLPFWRYHDPEPAPAKGAQV